MLRLILVAALVVLGAPESLVAVVISEVHYRPPAAVGKGVEFVELHEPGQNDVSLAGWRLVGAVDFVFPEDSVLPAGGYIVVARHREKFLEHFAGLRPRRLVDGAFRGSLDNSGEDVTLVDAFNAWVDCVPFDDTAPWPEGADGGGHSLQRYCAESPSELPDNWAGAGPTPGASYGGIICPAPTAVTPDERSRVVFSELYYHPPRGEEVLSVGDDGEALEFLELRNVGVVPVDLAGWTLSGVEFTFPPETVLAPGGFLAVCRDAAALRKRFAVDNVLGNYERRLSNRGERVSLRDAAGALVDSMRYRDAGDWPYGADGEGMSLGRIDAGASAETAANWAAQPPSPGRANAFVVAMGLPVVSNVRWFPPAPRAMERVSITARVKPRSEVGAVPFTVTVLYGAGALASEPRIEVSMVDDGRHRDGAAGDGVFGAFLPPFAHNTQVRFRVQAMAGKAKVTSPSLLDPATPRSDEVWGFYVNDLDGESELPVFHVLIDGIDGADWLALNSLLRCSGFTQASFAFEGELFPDVQVRFRGHTMCDVTKRNLKLRFRRGRLFRGVEKVNLNSLWTDKALVREHLAWDLLRELGAPSLETEYVRVHLNGEFHGLFLRLEHPESDFLERNALNPDGKLYKATEPSPGELRVGVDRADLDGYRGRWEEETSPGGDYADLAAFVDAMHVDGRSAMDPSRGFWETRSLEDVNIGYQVGQVAMSNLDSARKNHFLYHDLESDRWALLAWDLDLSFGKFFSGCAVDLRAGRRVGTLNDIVLCGTPDDQLALCANLPSPTDPWYSTTLSGPSPSNWFIELFLRSGRGHYQRAYLKRLWDVAREQLSEANTGARLDELRILLEGEARMDEERWGRYPSNVPGHPQGFAENLEIVQAQAVCHGEALRAFIEERHPEVTRIPTLQVSELLYLPEANDSTLEFIEIVNLTEFDADLSGWTLSEAVDYEFPEHTVIRAGEVFVVAREPEALGRRHPGLDARVFGPYVGKLSNGGEVLRLRDGGPGFPSTIDFLDYSSGGGWPEASPGEGIEIASVVAGRQNDRPEFWQLGGEVGGTPGATPSSFLRGDANGDGSVDIADVVRIAELLFRNGRAPRCLDAADSNDDGRVQLTDALFLLFHLVRGELGPPAPYPISGVDPSADPLRCAGES